MIRLLLVFSAFILSAHGDVYCYADLHYIKDKKIKFKNLEAEEGVQYLIIKKNLFYDKKPDLYLVLNQSKIPLSPLKESQYSKFLKTIVSKDEVVFHFMVKPEDYKKVKLFLFDKETIYTYIDFSVLVDYGKRSDDAKKQGKELKLPSKPKPKKGSLEDLERSLEK